MQRGKKAKIAINLRLVLDLLGSHKLTLQLPKDGLKHAQLVGKKLNDHLFAVNDLSKPRYLPISFCGVLSPRY
jgi:hypothetical protein